MPEKRKGSKPAGEALILVQRCPRLMHLWHKAVIPVVRIADRFDANSIVNALLRLHTRVVRWGIRLAAGDELREHLESKDS